MFFLARAGEVNKTKLWQGEKRKAEEESININKECHSPANLSRLTPPFLSGSLLSNIQVHQFTFYAPPLQLNGQAAVIVDIHIEEEVSFILSVKG